MKHLITSALLLSRAASMPSALPVRLSTRTALNSRLANIHVEMDDKQAVGGAPIDFTYGACDSSSRSESHHAVGRADGSTQTADRRLVWVIPEDVSSGGCISAWAGGGGDDGQQLVGRSAPQTFDHAAMRRRDVLTRRALDPVRMDGSNGIDANGPWFEGVRLLEDRNVSAVDAEAAKGKRIAIAGAGMAGLMSYLVLSQAGFTNLDLIEGSDRIGGRVQTEYLSGGPFDYSYQEMGPMRFPHQITIEGEVYNISDHQLVFQLAEEMNRLNADGNKDLNVSFIPWIQSSQNGLGYYDGFKLPSGLPPTVAQIAADPSLGPPAAQLDGEALAVLAKVGEVFGDTEVIKQIARNSFKAYKNWIKNGLGGLPGDHWSIYAYFKHHLEASLNATDAVLPSLFGSSSGTFWSLLYETVYFSSSSWKTIDGGLTRLPKSFVPHVEKDLQLNRKIERVSFSEEKKEVTLQWKGAGSELQSASYDYAVMAVPFVVMANWRLPKLGSALTNAIQTLPSVPACKIALEYKTRFWEKFENPIYGGCSTTTDIPGFESVCYPSYNLNGTGPASILASYNFERTSLQQGALSEEEHVQKAVDIMTEIHGDVAREQYTGNFRRVCSHHNEFRIGAYTNPMAGQMELYIPEYFKTHSNMIFIGEHTSYTHAWVASALESGIRGSVQLMLELGLVDEAKAAVDKWMARWIDV
ncbi:hypothetical protein MCOR25_008216 [Pyricularia grisea]|uniref:Amine oxidase domain-containing protein n=1 Tax=Pyricularia grisea TaxID=148305 RepID=A0A6P8BE22_PYRGI|nr:uncharacterized protein PgNI_04134 [Pyricularia grisea]KAI6355375.1 hypothetical protein MCOR25_008216 [Pyricularia grisea]TLD14060.1 hypothetical protein PgNI_04134 [Pyricularia grisea]